MVFGAHGGYQTATILEILREYLTFVYRTAAMSFYDAIKASIGAECYAHIVLLREFQEDCQRFEKVGLKVLPADIVDVEDDDA